MHFYNLSCGIFLPMFLLQGGGELGKYTCLICQKEFSSESGVKYHISKTHSQVGQPQSEATLALHIVSTQHFESTFTVNPFCVNTQ